MWWLLSVGTAFAGDKDKDGIPNNADKCVTEAEDGDGFQDADGCPDLDNDGDGRLDADDACPNEPEDLDGFDDADGCPDPDNDGDGLPDVADACPGETEDGDDRDGCASVSLELLTSTGWLGAVSLLSDELLAGVGQPAARCDRVANSASGWLSTHEPTAMRAEWEARLARAPEEFDRVGPTNLLAGKATMYRALVPMLQRFCEDHPGWQRVAPDLDAVYAALPAAQLAPKLPGPWRR